MDLEGAQCTGAIFRRCSFRGANLSAAIFEGATLTECDFG
jgi:uncharacterized protein YjbI with pentapeptide repeats